MQIITLDSVFCIEDLFFTQHKRFMAGVTIILLCIYVANCFCQNTFLVSFNEYLFNQCQCIEQTWWSFKVVLAQIDPFAPFATRSLILYISWFTLQTFRASDLWAKALKKKTFFNQNQCMQQIGGIFSPSFFLPKIPEKRCAKLWHNGAKSREENEILEYLFWTFSLLKVSKFQNDFCPVVCTV